jgi:hypothetical protein
VRREDRLQFASHGPIISHVADEFTRREREARIRQGEAAKRADAARLRAEQAGTRAEEIAAGEGVDGPDARRAALAEERVRLGFAHAREAHLRSARAHDEAERSARERGEDGRALWHSSAAAAERAAAAAEPEP